MKDKRVKYISLDSPLLESGSNILKINFTGVAPNGQPLVIVANNIGIKAPGVTSLEYYLEQGGKYDLAVNLYHPDTIITFYLNGVQQEFEIERGAEKVNILIIKEAEVCSPSPSVFPSPKPPVIINNNNDFVFRYQKAFVASEISTDKNTGIVCGVIASDHIIVSINGISMIVDSETGKNGPCYFSKDGGVTSTTNFLGATFFWNASIAGFTLKPWHTISFFNAYPVPPSELI